MGAKMKKKFSPQKKHLLLINQVSIRMCGVLFLAMFLLIFTLYIDI